VDHILILANGVWKPADIGGRLQELVSRADHVLATDGALDGAVRAGIRVDTLIGDLDSIADPTNLESRFPDMEIVRHPREKDSTDLELAVDWALERSPASITLFGIAGGRLDHTLANFALLEKGLHAGIPIAAVSGRETVRMIQGAVTLDAASVGDRVSLLPVSLFVTVSTQGLQYALTSEKLFRARGRGISNVVRSLPVRIEVEAGVLAVVHAAGETGEG
jgi:thiamine pyrophosphokinase